MILLIIPGWKQNSTHWENTKDKLSHNIETEVIDLPGFGIEPLISTEWGVKEYANWVQRKIEKRYRGQSVIMLGHSFGGRVVAEIAAKNPSWLKQIFLIASPLIYKPTARVRFLKSFSTHVPEGLKKVFQNLSSDDYKDVKDTKMQKIFMKTISYDQSSLLSKINLDTVIVAGENDKSVNLDIIHRTHKSIKNSTLEIIPKMGHNIHMLNPNLLYGIIQKFIKND